MSTLHISRSPRRVRGRCEGVPDDRFMAYKVSRDGKQDHYDHVYRLTFAEARDTNRFPLGDLRGKDGRLYMWSYGLMREYL